MMMSNIQSIKHIEDYKDNKKVFFELYEKSKNGEVDLLSLSPDLLKKMCLLLEEEINFKQKQNERKRDKLNKLLKCKKVTQ